MNDVDRPEWQDTDEVVITTSPPRRASEREREVAALVVVEIFRTFDPDNKFDRSKARRLRNPDTARGYVEALIDTFPADAEARP